MPLNSPTNGLLGFSRQNFGVTLVSTPPLAIYGRKPSTVIQHILGEVKVEVVARDLKDREEALRQLKTHLTRAQEHMRRTTNPHGMDVNFGIEDWVGCT